MRSPRSCSLLAFLVLAALALGCAREGKPARSSKKTIVATYSVLGAAVKELVGEACEVRTLIPNGLDVHEWEPSAKDIEMLTKADLVVENGLGLEGGLEKVLDQVRKAGVKVFTASDHIEIRLVGDQEGIPSGDPDQAAGAKDPHLWTDPMAIKAVATALAKEIQQDFGLDLSARSTEFAARLDALDREIRESVARLPAERRKLVTGHESLGYFAQRFGFKLVGAVVPGLTTAAESSAADIERLRKLIAKHGVTVILTEIGTSPRTVEILAKEAKVRALPIATHSVPADGSYCSFERDLAREIIKGLQ